MLISPPFLPTRLADETDDQWLDRAMFLLRVSGTYPIGENLCWHGGVHLRAPWVQGHEHLPVVAIADGKIVAINPAITNPNTNPVTPPQFDNSEHTLKFDDGRWTSDGAVVLEHETEIGATSAATPVPVRVKFYSIYHHLSEISAVVRTRGVGGTLYRKEKIGEAGYIAGVPHLIHFEIACDDTNLGHLIGRQSGLLDTSRNGRESVVFGEIYFRIPAGTTVYELPNDRRMRDRIVNNTPQTVNAREIAGTPYAAGAPQAIPPTQIKRTTRECFIGLRYASGEGVVAERGDLTVSTYLWDAANPESFIKYGELTRQNVRSTATSPGSIPVNTYGYNEAEYKLYYRVKEICAEWGATDADRPMPSAVLELLKFGRIINTAHHPTPAVPGQTVGDISAVPNWRRAIVPTGQNGDPTDAWINLNDPANIKVFSDADFPHWRGWLIANDDTDGDNRCDSASVRTVLRRAATQFNQRIAQYRTQFPDSFVSDAPWMQATLGTDPARNTSPLGSFRNEMFFLTGSEELANRMAHLICTIPSEWNSTTIDKRWGWLKTRSEENGDPMSVDMFDKKLKPFLTALRLDVEELDTANRRFHPRMFIQAFRQCLWFSAKELAQCLPRKRANVHMVNNNVINNVPLEINWANALSRSNTHYMALNKFFQKFCGHSRHRVIHNIAQILNETDKLITLSEYNAGVGKPYDAFFGRGYHQITWPLNYVIFGAWRNMPNHTGNYSDARITQTSLHYKDGVPPPPPGSPPGTPPPLPNFIWYPRFDPVIVERNNYEAAESSGVFWISKSFAGRKNLNRVCDLHDPTNVHNVAYVCWCVNGGDNGHSERQGFVRFLANILLDEPYKTASDEQFNILRAKNAGMNNNNPTFPPIYGAQPNPFMTAKVYYEFQRP